MFIEDLSVISHRRGWAVRRSGALRAISVHASRAEAEEKARRLAKREGVNLVLHDAAGVVIREERYETPTGRSITELPSA